MGFELNRIAKLFLNPFQHTTSQILVRHLTTAEPDGELHLILILKELVRVAHFCLIIVIVDTWPHLDFFEFDNLLPFPSLVGFLLLFVFKLAEVHDFADWRVYIWRYLNEIEAGIGGAVERITGANYPEVVTFIIEEADIRNANIAIGAELVLLVWLQAKRWTCDDIISCC